MSGKLILVPTPIDEENPLEQVAFKTLENAALNETDKSVFVIEDLKPGRRRWLRFGLPRSSVESFELFNEHNAKEKAFELIDELKKGKNVYLMSDGGLPAFCDPGQNLVELCHAKSIKVTATPFANSISLALALSGFDHNKFIFEGFLPVEKESRVKELKRVFNNKYTTVLMDTPYRMKRLLEEVRDFGGNRQVFLAMELGSSNERLMRDAPSKLLKSLQEFKKEFILVF